jgi:hypothetical protein
MGYVDLERTEEELMKTFLRFVRELSQSSEDDRLASLKRFEDRLYHATEGMERQREDSK